MASSRASSKCQCRRQSQEPTCSGKHLLWTSKPTAFQSKKSLNRLEIGPKHKPAALSEDIGDDEA